MKNKLTKHFYNLATLSSPSGHEEKVAEYIEEVLRPYPLVIHKQQGEYKNLMVEIDGTGPLILFDAHMDTVGPCEKVNVVLEDGVFRTDGTTVLGADDKAGIAVMLTLIETLVTSTESRAPIRFVFTVSEETGLKGAKNIEPSWLRNVQYAYVLDGEKEPGILTTQTPHGWKGFLSIIGKAAHAGVEPEKGLNALRIVTEALDQLPWGRVDDDTTFNVGTIKGGIATNVVMEKVTLEMESRSYRLDKLELFVQDLKERFALVADLHKAQVEWNDRFGTPGYALDTTIGTSAQFVRACNRCDITLQEVKTGGGSNANIYRSIGIDAIAISVGMRNIHSVNEYLLVEDLWNTYRLIHELVMI